MDLPTFFQHLDGRGSDLDAWPAEARAEAQVLVDGSTVARSAFLAMENVERLLRARPSRLDDRAPGVEALAATAMRRPQDRPASPLGRPAARAMIAAVAVLTLCLGLVLGWGPVQQEDGPDRVLAIAFDPAGAVDVD